MAYTPDQLFTYLIMQVDVHAGHQLLARACDNALSFGASRPEMPSSSAEPSESSGQSTKQAHQSVGCMYALRYSMAHVCHAGDLTLLRLLLLDIDLWEDVYTAGGWEKRRWKQVNYAPCP
jgi:hypothetical protein